MKAILVQDREKLGEMRVLVRATVRTVTTRLVLTSLIAGVLAMGLVGVAAAAIPLAIDRNDGYTFSGLETTSFAPRSVGLPFPINPPASVPLTTNVPFSDMIPGPGAPVILGYTRDEQSTYLFPACNMSIFKTIERSTFKAVVQYTTTVTGPLPLVGFTVVIPALANNNSTTVLPFDDVFTFSAAITSNGTTTSGNLAPTTPPPGAARAFSLLAVPANVTIDGGVSIEVTVGGPAAPPVGINVVPPPPGPGIPVPPELGVCANTLERRGAATVEIQDMSVVLSVQPQLVIAPANVTIDDGTVILFEPTPNVEARIDALQGVIDGLEQLIARLSGNPNPAVQRLVDALQGVLDRVNERLQALVPEDARYTVSGEDLGNGDVPATLTSLDANGDPIESYDLTLRPGSPVRSAPLVFVREGGRIASGPSGGLLFVTAESGGSVRVEADGYSDGMAAVTGP